MRLPLTSKLEVEVVEDMAAPVHMYFVLTDYFQNYIRYVRTVSYNQLHGDANASLADCVVQRRLDVEDRATYPDRGRINPCGLAAWSYFNDTFDNFEARPPRHVDASLSRSLRPERILCIAWSMGAQGGSSHDTAKGSGTEQR